MIEPALLTLQVRAQANGVLQTYNGDEVTCRALQMNWMWTVYLC